MKTEANNWTRLHLRSCKHKPAKRLRQTKKRLTKTHTTEQKKMWDRLRSINKKKCLCNMCLTLNCCYVCDQHSDWDERLRNPIEYRAPAWIKYAQVCGNSDVKGVSHRLYKLTIDAYEILINLERWKSESINLLIFHNRSLKCWRLFEVSHVGSLVRSDTIWHAQTFAWIWETH